MNHLSDYYQYLLAGKITGNLSAEELAELDIVLEKDPEVQEAYQQLLKGLPENAAQVVQQLEWKNISVPGVNRSGYIFRRIAVAAACIGIVLFSGWLYLRKADQVVIAVKTPDAIQLTLANGKVIDLSAQLGQIHEEGTTLINDSVSLHYDIAGKQGYSLNTVIVPAGRGYQITLSDGSKVWMNSMSKLIFPFEFSDNKREISIEGEAYVEVAKDAKRPFTVNLPGNTVRVLGTAFNVNTYDSALVKIALMQGAIAVNSNSDSLYITPGKEAVCNTNGHIIEQTFNPKYVLSWRQGIMYFEYKNLKTIGEVISRWYGIKVIIDNPELKRKSIKCILERDEPLDTFLKDLQFIAKIESVVDGNGDLHFR
jgi:transmembrane sensor